MEPSSRSAVAPSRIQRSMLPELFLTQLSKSVIVSENQVPRSGKTLEPSPARRKSASPRALKPRLAFLLPLMAFLKNVSTKPALVASRKPSAIAPTLLPTSFAHLGMWRSRSGMRTLCSFWMLSVAVSHTESTTTARRSPRSLAMFGTFFSYSPYAATSIQIWRPSAAAPAGATRASFATSPMSERIVNSVPAAPTPAVRAAVRSEKFWASWGTIMSRRGSQSTMSRNVRQRTRTPASWPIHLTTLLPRSFECWEMLPSCFSKRFRLFFWMRVKIVTTRSRASTASRAATASTEAWSRFTSSSMASISSLLRARSSSAWSFLWSTSSFSIWPALAMPSALSLARFSSSFWISRLASRISCMALASASARLAERSNASRRIFSI